MDKDGNMQLGFAPLNLRIEMKNFKLNLESTNTSLFPFKADQNMPRDELYATVDQFYRGLVQNLPLEESLQLSKIINTYGFGIALDANKDINVVYSFGQQGDYQPRSRLTDRLSNYEYVTPKGSKLLFLFCSNKCLFELKFFKFKKPNSFSTHMTMKIITLLLNKSNTTN